MGRVAGAMGRAAGRPAVVLATAGAALVVVTGMVLAVAAGGPHQADAFTPGLSSRVMTEHRPAWPARPARPLRVVAVSPAPGTRGAGGAVPVRVTFSAPLAAGSPMPRLSPAIPGTWARQGEAAVFRPAAGFGPGTDVTVTVPAGRAGVRGRDGAVLARAAGPYRYTTGSLSTLRLQQILAQLGYLPLNWAPGPGGAVPRDPGGELAAAYQPPPGTFTWAGSYPATLTSQWRAGSGNLLDTGAIMAFEADHGLAMDGTAGPDVWGALLRAAADGRASPHGYTYAVASEGAPETLTIWHDGHEVLTSLANTGIPAAPTATGTYPVYERLPFQIMKGTNPDGSHYADPVRYVAYFNGGDAVHYFPRASFGYPQSLGCVELPLDQAAVAWSYLSYGSLVTVSP